MGLWLDVDVAGYPADVLELLLAGGKDIVAPNCVVSETNQQYDLNTYRLKSVASDIDWQQYIIDGLLQPPGGIGRWYLNDLGLFDEVEVDAVGGHDAAHKGRPPSGGFDLSTLSLPPHDRDRRPGGNGEGYGLSLLGVTPGGYSSSSTLEEVKITPYSDR